MAVTNFSPLLGLALPTTGDLSGTWGTVVNVSITDLIDSAIAGTTTLSADTNVTLSTTNGAANQAREAILLCTGARTGLTTITAPAQSKSYIIVNATTGGQSVKIVGSGPTTGVTVPNGYKVLVAWNGSDFVKVASSIVNLTSEVTGTLPVANGGTGVTTSTGTTNVVLSDSPTLVAPILGTPQSVTLSNATGLPLTTGVTGILPIANGGTATATPALVAGSGVSISGTWPNQTISATGSGGTVTNVTATSPVISSGGGTPNISFIAAGASGNVLTSDGSTWSSQPNSGGSGVTTGKSIALSMIFGF